eukprot:NODE_20583_length_261_cov_12.396226_g19414_i0.p1 GENE.NODE_20583_length_261_cov_12.396226_g19414_i0~~NODE_20583_length_261_cov_12.396226_g19414_i0.p1  ORF type:complete len:54 (-),score=3.47 NODE_20583_length_261_cov_12.396226_g19414_i0:33-194(-)
MDPVTKGRAVGPSLRRAVEQLQQASQRPAGATQLARREGLPQGPSGPGDPGWP